MDYREILYQLTCADWEKLRQGAEQVLLQARSGHVFVRGLIEFSNICRRNCLYCGLRSANNHVTRYRMGREEILEAAEKAKNAGADTIVLQSGEGAADAAWLAEVVREIVESLKLPVTLSVGECDWRDYARWKDAGASRYLLRFESSDAALYARLHPGYQLEKRLECLRALKSMGYETGGGFIVGLPGQTLETLARDIELCQTLCVDMAGVGPFIAQTHTPLSAMENGGLKLALRVLAVLRLVLPYANLPATTALATLDPVMGQRLGLKAGANVLMPNFTPGKFSANYRIYDGKTRVAVESAARDIEACGRTHTLKVDTCH